MLDDSYTLTLDNSTNNRGTLALSRQDINSLLCISLRQRDNHTDTHIEDVEHLAMTDTAILLQETEDGKNLPATLLNLYALTIFEDAGNILVEAATCDMADAMNITRR